MNKTFSALNGSIRARLSRNKHPAVENAPSGLAVDIGIPSNTLATAANCGNDLEFFFQKLKALFSILFISLNEISSDSSVDCL